MSDLRNAKKVVVTQMKPREQRAWQGSTKKRKKAHHDRRLLRDTAIFAAVALCASGAIVTALRGEDGVQAVMSHLTAGFEYDDTLGRLQFVSNILPESAMVFLTATDEEDSTVVRPTAAQVAHLWSADEPWIEYTCTGEIVACQDGDIMTIVKNREDEYTVRVLHDGGYESIYSGLTSVAMQENDRVSAGEIIGAAGGFAAFELRKDGLSVLPVFGEI